MCPKSTRRAVATALLVFLAVSGSPGLLADDLASLSGRLLDSRAVAPGTGAVLRLVDADGEAASSAVIDEDGAFRLDAPAGAYRLLIESEEIAFVTDDIVTLAPGVNEPLALALRAQIHYQGQGTVVGGGSLPVWAKWAIAGGIGVAALAVVSDLNDEETPASAF